MDTQMSWDLARNQRSPLLTESDIVAVRCFKANIPFPTEWDTYVRALRDITTQEDPNNLVWPNKPSLPNGV